MKCKSFLVGILVGITLVGTYKYGYYLLAIPQLVATALFAIIGWFLKYSYERYIEEIQGLKRAETALITNLAKNHHNTKFFANWRKSLETNTLYTVVFRDYVQIIDFDIISDSELFNKLVKLNINYESLGLDLKNFYESYAVGSKEMLFTDHVLEWESMNKNMLKQTQSFEQSFKDAEKDTIVAIAALHCYFKQMRLSSFRIIRMLGTKVYPFKSIQRLDAEIKELTKQFADSKEE